MAPALTTNSSSPAPNAAVKDWTNFINTIGTSVGPLITLFGEQATKQFLSLSMGWADNILLAMGPIGIITIVVSAIRIAGYRWLQAIIGRYVYQSIFSHSALTWNQGSRKPNNRRAGVSVVDF